MKQFLSIILTLSLVTLSSASPLPEGRGTMVSATTALDWSNYESQAGRFTILAPGKPEISVEHNQTPVGQVDQQSCIWRSEGVEWGVEYSDVPEAALALNGSILFAQMRRGFQRNTGQPVKNETPWKFASYPGRAFEFYFAAHADNPARAGLARATLVGHRLYVLTVVWDKPTIPVPSEDATRFFDSFCVQYKSP